MFEVIKTKFSNLLGVKRKHDLSTDSSDFDESQTKRAKLDTEEPVSGGDKNNWIRSQFETLSNWIRRSSKDPDEPVITYERINSKPSVIQQQFSPRAQAAPNPYLGAPWIIYSGIVAAANAANQEQSQPQTNPSLSTNIARLPTPLPRFVLPTRPVDFQQFVTYGTVQPPNTANQTFGQRLSFDSQTKESFNKSAIRSVNLEQKERYRQLLEQFTGISFPASKPTDYSRTTEVEMNNHNIRKNSLESQKFLSHRSKQHTVSTERPPLSFKHKYSPVTKENRILKTMTPSSKSSVIFSGEKTPSDSGSSSKLNDSYLNDHVATSQVGSVTTKLDKRPSNPQVRADNLSERFQLKGRLKLSLNRAMHSLNNISQLENRLSLIDSRLSSLDRSASDNSTASALTDLDYILNIRSSYWKSTDEERRKLLQKAKVTGEEAAMKFQESAVFNTSRSLLFAEHERSRNVTEKNSTVPTADNQKDVGEDELTEPSSAANDNSLNDSAIGVTTSECPDLNSTGTMQFTDDEDETDHLSLHKDSCPSSPLSVAEASLKNRSQPQSKSRAQKPRAPPGAPPEAPSRLRAEEDPTSLPDSALIEEVLTPMPGSPWSSCLSPSSDKSEVPPDPVKEYKSRVASSPYTGDWLEQFRDVLNLDTERRKRFIEAEHVKLQLYEEQRQSLAATRNRTIREQICRARLLPVPVDEFPLPEGPEVPELTEEIEQEIELALTPYPEHQVLVSRFNSEITRRDIQTLNGLNWLNDEVILFYLNLLVQRSKDNPNLPTVHTMNTFFLGKLEKGYSGVRRWTKKVDIFALDYIIVPVHLGMHWCMCDSLHELFKIIESGEVSRLSEFNKGDISARLYERNNMGYSPMQVAVVNNNLEVLQVLLPYADRNILREVLVFAIVKKNYEASLTIVNNPAFSNNSKLDHVGLHHKASRPDNANSSNIYDVIPPFVTPLALAARNEMISVVHVLLVQGYRIKHPHKPKCTCKECQFSRAQDETSFMKEVLLNYSALSSMAYIVLTSVDPIEKAFTLKKELLQLANSHPFYKGEFQNLAQQVSNLPIQLLEAISNNEELTTVINKADSDILAEVPLARIERAIELEEKSFVAHPFCQMKLTDALFGGNDSLRNSGWLLFIFISVMTYFAYPVLVVLYVLFPFRQLKRFIEMPIVKFVMHFQLSLTFVWLISAMQQNLTPTFGRLDDVKPKAAEDLRNLVNRLNNSIENENKSGFDDIDFTFFAQLTFNFIPRENGVDFFENITNTNQSIGNASSINAAQKLLLNELKDAIELLLVVPIRSTGADDWYLSVLCLFVLGVLWEECKQVFSGGLSRYLSSSANVVDSLIVMLYLASLSLVNLNGYKIIYSFSALFDETLPKLFLLFDTVKDEADMHPKLNQLKEEVDRLMYWIPADRRYWDHADPMFVAEGLFAIANIFSYVRLTRFLQANNLIGPMLISLFKLIADLVKFASILVLIISAFLVGFYNLYWYLEEDTLEKAAGFPVHFESPPKAQAAFGTFQVAVQTLFWSIFGMADRDDPSLDNFLLHDGHSKNPPVPITHEVGRVMFMVYNIVVTIIFLNMMIAMLTESYDESTKSAETEWKFARSKVFMDYLSENDVLPPPYNLFPNIAYFVKGFFHVILSCFKRLVRSVPESNICLKSVVLRNVYGMPLEIYVLKEKVSVYRMSNLKLKSDEHSILDDDVIPFQRVMHRILKRLLITRIQEVASGNDRKGNVDSNALEYLTGVMSDIQHKISLLEEKLSTLSGPIIISNKHKTVRYYDSMGGQNPRCLALIKQYLSDEHKDKKGSTISLSNWKFTQAKDIPHQLNSSDCGVFSCKFADYAVQERTIDFSQQNMSYFRRRMIYEILKAKILDSSDVY